MASRGTKKYYSEQHENFIADLYGGRRSESSGAAVTDGGDVTDPDTRWECKYKGSPAEPLKGKPTILKQFEGIADEAWEVGREPALALRFYWPESVLAAADGWVDLSVRLVSDDRERNRRLAEAEELAWRYRDLSD